MTVDEMLEQRKEIYNLIQTHMKWKKSKVNSWMEKSNPNLGGYSPNVLWYKGKGRKILQFIKTIIDEHKRE